MSLESFVSADDLYLARAKDVNRNRPIIAGDVFANVPVPGVQADGMAIVIAHPCAIRGAQAELRERLLVAAVRPHSLVGTNAWTFFFVALLLALVWFEPAADLHIRSACANRRLFLDGFQFQV